METVRGPSKNKNKKQNKQTTTKKNQKGGIYTNLARKNNENSIGSPVWGVSVKRSRRANRSPSRWLFFLLLLCVQSHRKTPSLPSEYWLCGKFKDPSWGANVFQLSGLELIVEVTLKSIVSWWRYLSRNLPCSLFTSLLVGKFIF